MSNITTFSEYIRDTSKGCSDNQFKQIVIPSFIDTTDWITNLHELKLSSRERMSLSDLNVTKQRSSVLMIPTLTLMNTATSRPQKRMFTGCQVWPGFQKCIELKLPLRPLSLPTVSPGFLPALLIHPEDEGDTFLRKSGLSPNYTVLQHARPRSSFTTVRTSNMTNQ